jgi:hypothetical protein
MQVPLSSSIVFQRSTNDGRSAIVPTNQSLEDHQGLLHSFEMVNLLIPPAALEKAIDVVARDDPPMRVAATQTTTPLETRIRAFRSGTACMGEVSLTGSERVADVLGDDERRRSVMKVSCILLAR